MSELKEWIWDRSGFQILKVLHIGANTGQEASFYATRGAKVTWIEADPSLYPKLLANISEFPDQTAIQCLASDVSDNEVEFYITSNQGGSSSILQPDLRQFEREWPTVRELGSVRLKTQRLDACLRKHGCDDMPFDLVVADVQGYELPVLKGLGEFLSRTRIILCELNWTPMYVGATNPVQLEDYLVSIGFSRAWLGVSSCQAHGVWIRAGTGAWARFYSFITIRLYYVAVRLGLIRVMERARVLEFGRIVYCWLKKRNPG